MIPTIPNLPPFSRRRMLGGLAAAAVPLVLPTRLFGQAAPSKRIQLLVIGTGRQGSLTNLPTLLGREDVRVVGVCDVDRKRAELAKAKVDARYGTKDCKLFTDFREALEMPGLDAVMNSTPDHWHVLVSLAAVAKGLHVSCEKPVSLHLREGRVLADAVRAKGVVFRTDTECRSNAYMTKLADLAMNGYLGNVRKMIAGVPFELSKGVPKAQPMPVPAHLDYDLWLGPAPKRDYTLDRVHPEEIGGRPGWMRIRDYCEGIICNWGTHLLDVAQLINGTERTGPVSVEGKGRYPEPDSLWNTLVDFQVQFRHANGVIIDYRMEKPYLRVEGDEGWAQAPFGGSGGFTASDPKLLHIQLKPSDHRVPTRGDKQDFIEAIKNGTPVMTDAEIGHRTCSMGQIAHIAIQRGKRLDWDPAKEAFSGDPEANAMLHGKYREPWKLEG